MRVLIISHNVFSGTNNMGKTLLSYFHDFTPDEIAEFYIQEKEPKNADVCNSYYRITDRDALSSVFGNKVGTEYHIAESEQEFHAANAGVVESIRQYGRKRNAFVYTARNMIWGLAHWKTEGFLSWLRDFDPDVIFFMSGDYGFMYKITLDIQQLLHKPLVVCCVDDYFLNNRNEGSALGRLQHKTYMKAVQALMDRASCILTISDSMRVAYQELFQKPCHTLHTSSGRRAVSKIMDTGAVAYFGNLGYKRNEQLVQIGKAVKSLNLPNLCGIDVYSGEKNPNYLKDLTEENGIFFHGEITAGEVGERMASCRAIIHTESFDPAVKKIIRYSVSTKIADSLLNGPCLIAYGPEGIASIDYLRENHAAYVITRPEDLKSGLQEILTNAELREQIVKNARRLAAVNHDEAVNPKKVREWLQQAIDSGT